MMMMADIAGALYGPRNANGPRLLYIILQFKV